MYTLYPNATSRYGSSLGRRETRPRAYAPRSLLLRRVPIDAGGYDPGGAYWGLGVPLWLLVDRETEGGQTYRFTRAVSRAAAWRAFGLDPDDLAAGGRGIPVLNAAQRDTLRHLRASWGAAWCNFDHERKSHEWESFRALRAAIGRPDPGANPYATEV